MKIIQVITGLDPAGAERVVANLSIGLKKRKHSVCVISLQPLPEKSTILDDLSRNGIAVKSLNLTKFTPWRVFKLKKIIKDIFSEANLKFQTPNSKLLLHSHLIHANLVCRINNIFGEKFKLINTIHIAEKRKNKKWYFLFDKLTLNLCDRLTAVSKAAAEFHAKILGIPVEQIDVIYNGIEQPIPLQFHEINKLKANWGFSDCRKLIGSVGRLNRQKGYDVFINLLPRLSKKIPKGEKWGVVILGEGPERKKLEKLAKNNPDNIILKLPGYRKNAASCISTFDLFVMPSRSEGFGLSLAEAMALGVPILCSNADSLPEIIQNYPNGKVVDFSDENCLKEICSCINKKNVSAKNLFTIESMVDGYLEIYGKQISGD